MDERLAELRQQAERGDPLAATKLLWLRVKAGSLSLHRLRLAATLGHPLALLLKIEPAPLRNAYYNYPQESIGFNRVDGILGHLFRWEDCLTLGIEFVQHVLEYYYHIQYGRSTIEAALSLGKEKINSDTKYRQSVDEIFLLWGDESREEFYQKYNLDEIREAEIADAKLYAERADALYQEILNMALSSGSSESHIRWATAYVLRMVDDHYRPNLNVVAIADHCRLADEQHEELEWQRNFLANWLLR